MPQPEGRVSEPEIVRTRERVDPMADQYYPAGLKCRVRPGDEIEVVLKINGVEQAKTLKCTAAADDGASCGIAVSMRTWPNAIRSFEPFDPEVVE